MIDATKIQPLLLHLPDTEQWVQRHKDGLEHFLSVGFRLRPIPGAPEVVPHSPLATHHLPFLPIIEVPGVHAAAFGIRGTRKFRGEDPYGDAFLPVPEDGTGYIGDGKVGGFLSHYILYVLMQSLDAPYYMVLEDDARFTDPHDFAQRTWREMLLQALNDVPDDFDILFVGSSDTYRKPTERIKGNVYEVKYPMCGHCYIASQKAAHILIATQRNAYAPVDINLMVNTFPQLKVYTILPRLAEQQGTILNI